MLKQTWAAVEEGKIWWPLCARNICSAQAVLLESQGIRFPVSAAAFDGSQVYVCDVCLLRQKKGMERRTKLTKLNIRSKWNWKTFAFWEVSLFSSLHLQENTDNHYHVWGSHKQLIRAVHLKDWKLSYVLLLSEVNKICQPGLLELPNERDILSKCNHDKMVQSLLESPVVIRKPLKGKHSSSTYCDLRPIHQIIDVFTLSFLE